MPTTKEITIEFIHELRDFFSSNTFIDTALPTFIFFIAVSFTTISIAFMIALSCSILLLFRSIRSQHSSTIEACIGMGGLLIALTTALFFQDARTFYLPGVLSYVGITLVCILSIILKHPALVWSSRWYRKWPKEWYRHPKVLPVYIEATIIWFIFFLVRSIIQILIYIELDLYALVIVDFLIGWPTTILLLYITLFYGRRRFIQLGGPSVEEFITGATPPFRSQRKGF